MKTAGIQKRKREFFELTAEEIFSNTLTVQDEERSLYEGLGDIKSKSKGKLKANKEVTEVRSALRLEESDSRGYCRHLYV
ncbi:hypothetical protein J6590_066098 [Homalodisca vitripennis]|nr:hypothetical protein J6590_066098 [Homalodisca vitripennis]